MDITLKEPQNKIPNENLRHTFIEADDLRNSGQTDQAVEKYKAIAVNSQESGETAMEAQAHQMIGVTLSNPNAKGKQIDDALDHFNFAERIFREQNDTLNVARVIRDKAGLFINAGKFDENVRTFFDMSISLLFSAKNNANTREVNSEIGITLSKLALATLYFEKNVPKAEGYIGIASHFILMGDNEFFKASYYIDNAQIKIAGKKDPRDDLNVAQELLTSNPGSYNKKIAQIYILRILYLESLEPTLENRQELDNYSKILQEQLDQMDNQSRKSLESDADRLKTSFVIVD